MHEKIQQKKNKYETKQQFGNEMKSKEKKLKKIVSVIEVKNIKE